MKKEEPGEKFLAVPNFINPPSWVIESIFMISDLSPPPPANSGTLP